MRIEQTNGRLVLAGVDLDIAIIHIAIATLFFLMAGVDHGERYQGVAIVVLSGFGLLALATLLFYSINKLEINKDRITTKKYFKSATTKGPITIKKTQDYGKTGWTLYLYSDRVLLTRIPVLRERRANKIVKMIKDEYQHDVIVETVLWVTDRKG
ncbi:hypothetical protein D3C87_741930 [compost metagenome]